MLDLVDPTWLKCMFCKMDNAKLKEPAIPIH